MLIDEDPGERRRQGCCRGGHETARSVQEEGVVRGVGGEGGRAEKGSGCWRCFQWGGGATAHRRWRWGRGHGGAEEQRKSRFRFRRKRRLIPCRQGRREYSAP
jgi:hypothetical protein